MSCASLPMDEFCRSAMMIVRCAKDVDRVVNRALASGDAKEIPSRKPEGCKRHYLGVNDKLKAIQGFRLFLEEAEEVARCDS